MVKVGSWVAGCMMDELFVGSLSFDLGKHIHYEFLHLCPSITQNSGWHPVLKKNER